MSGTKKELNKRILSLTVPIALQQLLLTAVSAGDSLMLGFVDEEAMAAVSLAANIEFIESLFLSALIGGATVISAQYWGKGEREPIERIFGLILRLGAVISGLFFVASLTIAEWLMSLFTAEAELISIGAEYIRMASLSYLFTGVSQCYLCIMKTTDQAKKSVMISSCALCLDTVLNAIFILLFNMGVAGAALTTSISRLLELIAVLICSGKMPVKPKIHSKIPSVLLNDFLHCSVPHLINSLLWGLGASVYSSIIGHLGGAVTAAYSVQSTIRNTCTAIPKGLGQGTEIILADTLGAGRLADAKSLGKRMSRYSIICGLFCGIFALIVGEVLLGVMKLSDETRSILQTMIYICVFYSASQCINIVVVCGIFAAGGDTKFDAYSVAVVMWAVVIPLALAAAFLWKLSPIIVYAILSLDEIIKIPWVYVHYKKYKWVNNITKEKTL